MELTKDQRRHTNLVILLLSCIEDAAVEIPEAKQLSIHIAKNAANKISSMINERDANSEEMRIGYQELIHAVVRKYPNESRHETALRYIRETEKIAMDSGEKTTPHYDCPE